LVEHLTENLLLHLKYYPAGTKETNMVTASRKLVTIMEAEKIIKESKTPDEAVEKLRSLPKRQPAAAAPEGGISIRAASRKYHVGHPLLSDWRKRGIILTLLKTTKEVYVSEDSVIKAVSIFNTDPGRGKRTVINYFKAEQLIGNK